MKEFKKFPSLENTYQVKPIQIAEELGFDKEQYIVTEKVHGANFSFWVYKDLKSGKIDIKCAKRSGWIEDGEKFFNYKLVLEKYRPMLEKLRDDQLDDFVMYGEMYGGNIQSGMCYKLEQDFVAFDMRWINEDGSLSLPLSKLKVLTLDEYYNIPVTPLIGVYDSFEEALSVEESFTSKLIRENFDGAEKHKEAEGVVIEPVIPKWFPNGSRVYFKKKTKRFLEKGGNKIHKPVENLPKELEGVLTQAFEYITEPRYSAVTSKIGEVTIKDIGKVMGFMTKDILEDMEKDSLIIPENKKFMKLLQQEVQNFIRPILLQN